MSNNPVRFNDPTGHRACDDQDENGNCIDVELKQKRLENKLKRFKALEQAEEDEMIPVGTGPYVANLSPAEYDLLLDENGNLDYGLLLRMYQIQQKAFNATQQIFGVNGWNDPADAFRHAYWNALLTREFGFEFAKVFTTAHETGYVDYDNTGEVFMDLHNNEVGRLIGVANSDATDEQLQQLVLVALETGLLYVWDGENIYYSDECPSCSSP